MFIIKVRFLQKKINFAVWYFFACRFRIILISIVSLLLLSQTSPAIAETTNTPKTCQMGAYLMSLHDFNLQENSFDADLWLWSVCPSADLEPLKEKNIDFINAKEVKRSELQTKDNWSLVKIKGTFRHNWNVDNLPFDRHELQIIIEHSSEAVSYFKYEPYKEKPKRDKDTFEDWKITDFTVTEDNKEYKTNFADPNLLEDTGTVGYSRLYISIKLERNSLISFFKITAPVYITYAISLLAYVLKPSSAASLLAGTLFTIVVNRRVLESFLGTAESLTLVDTIHITAMIYILVTAVLIIYSNLQHGYEEVLPIYRYRRIFRITWISYVVVNMVIIVTAVIAG
ncbi:MAG: hypothetical protein F6K40_05940 [Okeania sp. SIO3I5]|uniref:hypothetical protein n=1 Tax=Okeania sp. SIO3I5 TaxID=2607805 RepID=UPI0013B6CB31|nr:hypothetical protein [Okeania sp. SIO3I5]NEQ35848.1 hypothetical protein [Okeania sp. SIO3I5]